jgi:dipeptidyl aminopeptidase/acylaminoacyl peptidase
MSEAGPVLLADGTLLYSTYQDADWGNDLYMAQASERGFVDPRPLLINSPGSESHPALSPDGRFLIFHGMREMDAYGEEDLYVSERTEIGWGEPRLLPQPINSPTGDAYPSFSPDGRRFFFASERGLGGSWSIYYVDTAALGLEDESGAMGSPD